MTDFQPYQLEFEARSSPAPSTPFSRSFVRYLKYTLFYSYHKYILSTANKRPFGCLKHYVEAKKE